MKKNYYFTLFPKTKTITNPIKGIKISYRAEKQMYKLIKKNKKIGIELIIQNSGCAGMKYHMKLIEKTNLSDIIFVSPTILILINQKFLSILDGTIIDYIKKGINYNFQFKNEKIKDFCGCGESFNI